MPVRSPSRSFLLAVLLVSLVAAASPAEEALNPAIRFLVTVPGQTPAGAEVWLSGNQPGLGNWNGAGVRLSPRTDGRYEAQVKFPVGTRLEFKVTRGSWETVEKGPAGEELDNRTHTVTVAATVEATVASWADQWSGPPSSLTGLIRYHRQVGEGVGYVKARDLIVYLPPGYESQPGQRYPVLYMHDGQNLMDASTSAFGVEWGVDEAAQRLILAGEMEPIIIVGVYNTSDRIDEYTHVPDLAYGGGRADDYGRFLVEVVKPLVDATYRTQPEASRTGVAGSSLGGLVSMYFGLTRPETFGRLGLVSPSIWWANRDIVGRVEALPAKLPLHLWEDMGTSEGTAGSAVNDARALRDALVRKGWRPGEDFAYVEVEGGRHNEASWAARAGDILKFLYPPRPAASHPLP